MEKNNTITREKDLEDIEGIGEALTSQTTQAALIDAGWIKGSIFKRKDSLDYPHGYGVFTGEWGFSEDYTLHFTDGNEFLHNNCTLVQIADPEVAWFINLELNRIQQEQHNFIELIKENYNKIYAKAIQK